MKSFHRFAGVIFILALFAGTAAAAGYRFDDLYGPSGKSFQWMVLNTGSETFGADHLTAMDVSSDLILSEGIVDVINGTPDRYAQTNRSLSTLFLVLTDGQGKFNFNIHSPHVSGEAVAGEIRLGTPTSETTASYNSTSTANGPTSGDAYDSRWSSYTLTINRQTAGRSLYDTVRQTLNYYQNPSDTSSQGINKPIVIANVVNGTATDEALELRMTLRDSSGNGNIVAYRHDTWDAQNEKTTESENWVLAPVADLNTDASRINYYLTTELVNHTAVRYGAEDASSNWLYPNRWKFDLPRYQGTTDIEHYFYLDEASNAAPGLVSVYERRYNLNERNIRPLRIYAVDDNMRNGMWDLRLNYDILFVKQISDPYQYGGDATYNQIQITAFEPNPASLTFYETLADITGGYKDIDVMSSFQTSAISRTLPTSDALEYFTVNHSIPGSQRTSTTETLLPLHITINIPVTKIKDKSWWNTLVNEWRTNGHIESTFAQNMSIYLMAENNNILNMTEELQRVGTYSSQVKIFLDEERGRATNDNDQGVITISFVIFLMNGTRDGVRPELSMVSDTSGSSSRSYIAIRDGTEDSYLNMQVFVAPSDYYHNDDITPTPIPEPDNTPTGGGGGGGGGCNSGFYPVDVLFAGAVLFALKRERRYFL